MANIQPYIDQIQNAVYGEEVRSSIINALEAVNDDNESYQEIKEEIVSAKDTVEEVAENISDQISTADGLATTLEGDISVGQQVKSELEDSTTTAQQTKGDLDSSIQSGTTLQSDLEDLVASGSSIRAEVRGYAETATQKATEASQSATTAVQAKTETVTAKNTAVEASQIAVTKAGEASQSATTATQKATEAGQSATTAVQAKDTAVTKATEAGQSAQSASQSAQTATAKAQEAVDSAQSVSASATQIQTNKNDISAIKADFSQLPTDGVTANAKQLLSSNGTDNTEPYMFRAVQVNADGEEVNAVVGGTVAWNQLVQNGNFADVSAWSTYSSRYTVSGNVATIEHLDANGFIYQPITGVSAHKYLITVDVRSDTITSGFLYWDSTSFRNNTITPTWINVATVFNSMGSGINLSFRFNNSGDSVTGQLRNFMVFDLTQMFGSTIADYIYNLEQSTAGAGVAFFRKYYPNDYYPFDAGTLKSVEGVSAHETVGFNQWDEEWELGLIEKNTGINVNSSINIRSKNFIPVIPSTNYYYLFRDRSFYVAVVVYYDKDKKYIGFPVDQGYCGNVVLKTPDNCHYVRFYCGQSYGTTYNHDICINISDPAKNGTYEPYEKHSYALDPSVVLRGIPKLTDGKLYYDGDRYLPDGTVERRYGIVDLGTLGGWMAYSGYPGLFYLNTVPSGAKIPAGNTVVPSLIANGYIAGNSRDIGISGRTKGEIALAQNRIYISNDTYTADNVSDFRTAISGVMLVYELATPTTETATPYQSLQVCDPNGTEEFVSTGIVPVGHETFYPENLRAKIEGLPWDFSTLIAPTETGTASRNYTVGSLLIMGNVLYKVTANIANGGTITPGTNCTATTLSEVISALQ